MRLRPAAMTALALAASVLALAGCSSSATAPDSATASAAPSATTASAAASAGPSGAVPRPAHVVVVIEENKAYGQVAGEPFFAWTMGHGATFTDFHAEGHPSEPNYLALWSGSTHGLTSDACPVDLGAAPSLGGQLVDAGRTVAVYSEQLPHAGFSGCSAGDYARKHNPLADFSATSGAAHNRPFSSFPTDFDRLPDVAVVVPDLADDMHDGTIADGDRWLQQHLARYATWAQTHDSLLVLTADEDDDTSVNRIFTAVVGQHVRPGTYPEPANHYRLLHTLEAAFGLPAIGAPAPAITDVWR